MRSLFRAVRFSLLAYSLSIASSHAQVTGSIRGSVVDEMGTPLVAAQVSVDAMDSRPQSTAVPQVETDKLGRFSIEGLQLGSYKIFAMKESARYPNTGFAFYSNHIFPTATLSATAPVVNLVLKVGPPAGLFEGLVTDAITHRPVDATFLLRRVASPNSWISLAQRSQYHVLVPPDTDVSLEVSAPGYRTYHYGDASDALRRAPLKLISGEKRKLDFQLEPNEPEK